MFTQLFTFCCGEDRENGNDCTEERQKREHHQL